MNNVGIIILAAGKSERLGHPKQLVELENSNLINHSVACAVASAPFTFLVLGANSEKIIPELNKTKAIVVQNPDWQEGMASSIRIGLAALKDLFPQADAVVFMTCDQPFISNMLLQNIIAQSAASGKGIVASKYADTLGTPVLFSKAYFRELESLSGDVGAKALIKKHASNLCEVIFENGDVDIDTEADIQRLKNLI